MRWRGSLFALLALLALLALTPVACNRDHATGDGGACVDVGPPCTTHFGALHAGFAINRIRLPQGESDFASDVIGDGQLRNRLGRITARLFEQQIDNQGPVDQAIVTGVVSLLLDVQTSDAMLATDEVEAVGWYGGKSPIGMLARDDAGLVVDGGACAHCPDFSGMGSFAVDAAQTPGTFFGRLAAGHFSSNSPITTKSPVTVTVKLALFRNQPPIAFIVNGAHLQFDTAPRPGDRPALLRGQLSGSIKSQDFQRALIPALATLFTEIIRECHRQIDCNPLVQAQLDVGNCQNPDGSQARAGDGSIDYCEVAKNATIQKWLAPDVQIDDAMGAYAPNKANAKLDSVSFGIGFDAVSAIIGQ